MTNARLHSLHLALLLTLGIGAAYAWQPSTAHAQDLRAYDTVDDDHTWEGITLVVDMGFHSGNKPGGSSTDPNVLPFNTIDDRSLNMRMGLMSWPARSPFNQGSTVFGQPVGYSLELWGGIYSLFGGGASEDYLLRGGLSVDILYPVIQARNFAVVATFQGALVSDSTIGGMSFGPGLSGVFQAGSIRVLGEYRFIPLWIGDNVIAHDIRARLHFQIGDTFFLGVFGSVNIAQDREPEAGYTRRAISLGLEMGF